MASTPAPTATAPPPPPPPLPPALPPAADKPSTGPGEGEGEGDAAPPAGSFLNAIRGFDRGKLKHGTEHAPSAKEQANAAATQGRSHSAADVLRESMTARRLRLKRDSVIELASNASALRAATGGDGASDDEAEWSSDDEAGPTLRQAPPSSLTSGAPRVSTVKASTVGRANAMCSRGSVPGQARARRRSLALKPAGERSGDALGRGPVTEEAAAPTGARTQLSNAPLPPAIPLRIASMGYGASVEAQATPGAGPRRRNSSQNGAALGVLFAAARMKYRAGQRRASLATAVPLPSATEAAVEGPSHRGAAQPELGKGLRRASTIGGPSTVSRASAGVQSRVQRHRERRMRERQRTDASPSPPAAAKGAPSPPVAAGGEGDSGEEKKEKEVELKAGMLEESARRETSVAEEEQEEKKKEESPGTGVSYDSTYTVTDLAKPRSPLASLGRDRGVGPSPSVSIVRELPSGAVGSSTAPSTDAVAATAGEQSRSRDAFRSVSAGGRAMATRRVSLSTGGGGSRVVLGKGSSADADAGGHEAQSTASVVAPAAPSDTAEPLSPPEPALSPAEEAPAAGPSSEGEGATEEQSLQQQEALLAAAPQADTRMWLGGLALGQARSREQARRAAQEKRDRFNQASSRSRGREALAAVARATGGASGGRHGAARNGGGAGGAPTAAPRAELIDQLRRAAILAKSSSAEDKEASMRLVQALVRGMRPRSQGAQRPHERSRGGVHSANTEDRGAEAGEERGGAAPDSVQGHLAALMEGFYPDSASRPAAQLGKQRAVSSLPGQRMEQRASIRRERSGSPYSTDATVAASRAPASLGRTADSMNVAVWARRTRRGTVVDARAADEHVGPAEGGVASPLRPTTRKGRDAAAADSPRRGGSGWGALQRLRAAAPAALAVTRDAAAPRPSPRSRIDEYFTAATRTPEDASPPPRDGGATGRASGASSSAGSRSAAAAALVPALPRIRRDRAELRHHAEFVRARRRAADDAEARLRAVEQRARGAGNQSPTGSPVPDPVEPEHSAAREALSRLHTLGGSVAKRYLEGGGEEELPDEESLAVYRRYLSDTLRAEGGVQYASPVRPLLSVAAARAGRATRRLGPAPKSRLLASSVIGRSSSSGEDGSVRSGHDHAELLALTEGSSGRDIIRPDMGPRSSEDRESRDGEGGRRGSLHVERGDDSPSASASPTPAPAAASDDGSESGDASPTDHDDAVLNTPESLTAVLDAAGLASLESALRSELGAGSARDLERFVSAQALAALVEQGTVRLVPATKLVHLIRERRQATGLPLDDVPATLPVDLGKATRHEPSRELVAAGDEGEEGANGSLEEVDDPVPEPQLPAPAYAVGALVYVPNAQFDASKQTPTRPRHWVGRVLATPALPQGHYVLQWLVETSVGSRVFVGTPRHFTAPAVALRPCPAAYRDPVTEGAVTLSEPLPTSAVPLPARVLGALRASPAASQVHSTLCEDRFVCLLNTRFSPARESVEHPRYWVARITTVPSLQAGAQNGGGAPPPPAVAALNAMYQLQWFAETERGSGLFLPTPKLFGAPGKVLCLLRVERDSASDGRTAWRVHNYPAS